MRNRFSDLNAKNIPALVLLNGRLVPNPALNNTNRNTDAEKITTVCTIDNANAAAEAMGREICPSILSGLNKIQSPEYLAAFQASNAVSTQGLLAGITAFFQQYNVPITILNKVADLADYKFNFLIDDSGSMAGKSSLRRSEASAHMQLIGDTSAPFMTRWEEVEDRLHTMLNLIQFIPTGKITMHFLNRSTVIELTHHGMSPEAFANDAHKKIRDAFSTQPDGFTPIISRMRKMLSRASGKTLHYLLTDGDPNEYQNDWRFRDDENPREGAEKAKQKEINDIKDLLLKRSNPQNNPFTFMCASNNSEETEWMHEVEEIACRPGAAGYVAALRNCTEERKEVLNDQGRKFPYNIGLWRICCFLAALNPNDLDALDQHAPLTKPTMDNLLGYPLTDVDYRAYFESHPNAMWLFQEDYNAFLTAAFAIEIPAVRKFETLLASRLGNDINCGQDSTEPLAINKVEQEILKSFNRKRPASLQKIRNAFWNQYVALEKQQSPAAERDLWTVYVERYANLEWQQFCLSQQSCSPQQSYSSQQSYYADPSSATMFRTSISPNPTPKTNNAGCLCTVS